MDNELITDLRTIKRLFPVIDRSALYKLKIDKESKMYISTRDIAEKISFIIKNKLNEIGLNSSNITITDATSGVGGDTISFAKNFKNINAVELDPIRCEYLKNNIECYNLKNVSIYNENCLDIIYELENQDIVFIDPPWGGYGYKQNKNLKLTLENNEGVFKLEDVCNNLLNEGYTRCVPKLIILKLPINYDITFLMNKIKSDKIYIHDLKKMFIITIIR
tara:strand:- start:7303 stop:7962 length:660 start_codon:yes stop_codon:yes gene_type:complete